MDVDENKPQNDDNSKKGDTEEDNSSAEDDASGTENSVNSRPSESVLAPKELRDDLSLALRLLKQATKRAQEDYGDVPIVHEIHLT